MLTTGILKHIYRLLLISLCIFSTTANANDRINYDNLEARGFGEVAHILKNMTPEQRNQVLEKARKIEKELKKLSPKEQQEIVNNLNQLNQLVDFQTIDIESLNPENADNLNGIRSKMKLYLKNYSQE